MRTECDGPKPTPSACHTPGKAGANPASPIPLTVGNKALVDSQNQPIYRPDDGHDPAYFVDQGAAAASSYNGELQSLAQLYYFGQGRVYDEQHPGGTNFNPIFTNYASIAIGLYAYAAGISLSNVLSISNQYASMNSRYPPGTVMDATYTSLPVTNVNNEKTGYALAQQNSFQVCQ